MSYESNYGKQDNRLGMMELCIEDPKKAGLKTYYLPRGVMTWGSLWPQSVSLQESWQFDLEDIARFRPDGVWWFGCGITDQDGAQVTLSRLRQSGFSSGREARLALLNHSKEASK